MVVVLGVGRAQSQTNTPQASDLGAQHPRLEDSRDPKVFLKHLLEDQGHIWTSPFRLKPEDAEWLVPVGGITTGLIMTDRTASHELTRGSHISLSNNISNIGIAAYSGGVVGMYLLGRRDHDSRQQETGILAAEAGINAFGVSEALKYAFERNRPLEGDGTGHFFRPVSGSFYSAHSTVAFSFATVIASEYPGWLSTTLAYGGATGISLARVTGQQHWPSDVFVGAVSGYLIGKDVYRRRHDPDIDSTQYGVFIQDRPNWNSGNSGSTFVPLDEWEYPVIDRLIAAGLVRTQILGIKPYTRTAMADMVSEAEYRMEDNPKIDSTLRDDVAKLRVEFSEELGLESRVENKTLRLPEEVYTRMMYISGTPLTDSYHFGQTIINDYGRPYQSGFNEVTGFRARAVNGRYAFYVNGEYQHAPGAAADPLSVRQVIADVDLNPVQPGVPTPTTNQFRLLDAYASMTLAGHSISVGKQSLWWGPSQGSAMILSNNAEPIYMVRIDRQIPLRLPWILKYLGQVRYEAFFGKLEEHQFPPQPYTHGQKFSFKPTENLEFGFSRTAVFAGQGLTPLTFRTFWTSLTSTTSSTNPGFNLRNSAGVRHSEFDFSYRIPGLRNWLTVYTDSLVHDDVSPIDAPRRAAIIPGIYLTHFPKISKLDFRAESGYTDMSIPESNGGHFIYWEGFYRDVYTNKKNLLGSWIGREGKGSQIWSTYWFSPQSTLQWSYRNAKVAKDFIPGGETVNDFAMRAQIMLRPDVQLTTFVQYEQWKAPVLAPDLQKNVTGSIEIKYWPKKLSFSEK